MRPTVYAASLLFAALLTLVAGCSEPPPPTSIEVYAENSATHALENGTIVYEPKDGSREKSGTCTGTAQYQSHVNTRMGSVTVTVIDAAGATHSYSYAGIDGDELEIEGPPGNWTVRVQWTGFSGSVHAGLLC